MTSSADASAGDPSLLDRSWPERWSRLAEALSLAPATPVVVALSGGADSVLLLHVVARSKPRPRMLAVHVDHGLRGEESRGDAAFCARACARLAVPFVRRQVELDPYASNLEARAREARYHALAEEARRAGIEVVLTAHHGDDALETLLLRWMRGTALSGLSGLRKECVLGGIGGRGAVRVLRPFLSLRREEMRAALEDAGIAWREDSSNESPRFTRNRVRHRVLPEIERACGVRGIENLRAFARAVSSLEDELASRTAHLVWQPLLHAPAHRSSAEAHLGGTLPREALCSLASALQRRALWRLLTEGTGASPSRALLQACLDDLAAGRSARHNLSSGWMLRLRARSLELLPPSPRLARSVLPPARGRQLALPFRWAAAPSEIPSLLLPVDGAVELPDGRAISAELVAAPRSRAVPRSGIEVELDAADLPSELVVRTHRPGDRFHGLGAPGSRRLTRFLADAGVPREERQRVPLVFAGNELIWVAGIRPCEARRVHVRTERRLLLRLLGAAPARPRATERLGLFEREPR
jgi:tRNA(Ile)-lysidine synthase